MVQEEVPLLFYDPSLELCLISKLPKLHQLHHTGCHEAKQLAPIKKTRNQHQKVENYFSRKKSFTVTCREMKYEKSRLASMILVVNCIKIPIIRENTI